MGAGLRFLGMAHEAVDPALIYGSQAVHLQERPLLVLDKHQFGQHQTQAREGRHHVVSRLGVFGIEAVERKEHRRKPSVLAYHVGFAQRCQSDAATQTQVAYGAFLVVVHELIGKTLLQHAEGVNDIGVQSHRARIKLSHGTLHLRATFWPDPTAAAFHPYPALRCACLDPMQRPP